MQGYDSNFQQNHLSNGREANQSIDLLHATNSLRSYAGAKSKRFSITLYCQW
jgi:hypothetical protein